MMARFKFPFLRVYDLQAPAVTAYNLRGLSGLLTWVCRRCCDGEVLFGVGSFNMAGQLLSPEAAGPASAT